LHNVLVTLDSSGNPIRYYIWGRGLVEQVEADGTVRYYHQDGQGSTLALTDNAGNISDQWVYSPYGEIMARTGSTATPYLWIGGHGVWAHSSGLYHMKARYYLAGVKRFLTADSVGVELGGNLYWYVSGNPLFSIDPLGLDQFVVIEPGHTYLYVEAGEIKDTGEPFYMRYDFSLSGFAHDQGSSATILDVKKGVGKVDWRLMTQADMTQELKKSKAVYQIETSSDEDRSAIYEIVRQEGNPPDYIVFPPLGTCVQRSLSIVEISTGIDLPLFIHATYEMWSGKSVEELIAGMEEVARLEERIQRIKNY